MAKQKLKPQHTIGKTNTTKKEISLKNSFCITVIILLVFLLYFPILNNGFTYDDDVTLVKDNYEFLSNTSNFTEIFKHSVFHSTSKSTDTYYRPILTLSFFADTQIAGKHYWFFFLTDILLHLSCCILLFFLLKKLLYSPSVAFLFSVILAIHPALTTAVAWLPGRNDTLLTLFSLLSFYFLIEYTLRKKFLFFLLHIIFLIIAILTKESALFLPFLFGLYIILWKKDNISVLKKINEYKILFLCWIAIFIGALILRNHIIGNSVGLPLSFVIPNYFINLPAIVQYIGKMLIPAHLSTMPVMQDIPFYYGFIVLILLGYLIWKTKSKNKGRILFGTSWVFIFLSLSILRTNSQIETLFFEHRMYFPIIGFMIVAAETDFIKNFHLSNHRSKGIMISIVVLYFFTAWFHKEDFKDEYHFWKKAADGSPHSSVALRGLAVYYQANHQADKSVNLYLQCMKLNPGIPEVRNNLGRIFMDNGIDSTAERLFYEEIQISPTSPEPYSNLGHMRYVQQNYTEAEQFMKKALSINPDDVILENDLAACLAMEKKYSESIETCIKILQKFPTYEYPKEYIRQIFSIWEDKEKVNYYKSILNKKGIVL